VKNPKTEQDAIDLIESLKPHEFPHTADTVLLKFLDAQGFSDLATAYCKAYNESRVKFRRRRKPC
jgi:3-methyladenine DNA glycosylase Tag